MKLKLNKANVLASYAYLRNNSKLEKILLHLSNEGVINLLIDSGAFTAYHSGNPIDLNSYIEKCKLYKEHVWQYVTLDVVRNKDETRVNFYKMLQAGLNPMSTLTMDEDISAVTDYIKLNSHIGVPGGTVTKGPWLIKRFQQVHKISEGKANIHALGYVTFPDVYRVPIKTMDSSTWLNGTKYGIVHLFDKRTGMSNQRTILFEQEVSKIPERLKQAWVNAGLSPSDRNKKEYLRGATSYSMLQTSYSYVEFMYLSYLYNRNLFLVVGDVNSLFNVAVANWAYTKKKTFNYFNSRNLFYKLKEDVAKGDIMLLKECFEE